MLDIGELRRQYVNTSRMDSDDNVETSGSGSWSRKKQKENFGGLLEDADILAHTRVVEVQRMAKLQERCRTPSRIFISK